MIYYLKGDIVKLRSGDTGEIIDSWGSARYWHKIMTPAGKRLIVMDSEIESLIKRPRDKKSKWR